MILSSCFLGNDTDPDSEPCALTVAAALTDIFCPVSLVSCCSTKLLPLQGFREHPALSALEPGCQWIASGWAGRTHIWSKQSKGQVVG